MEESLPPQGRAAKAVYLLVKYGSMTSSELMERLGYRKRDGLNYMMKHLAETVPVVYEEDGDTWRIDRDENGEA